MPTSTAAGRAVKDILDHPQFIATMAKGAKTKFCNVVDIVLGDRANDLIQKLSKQSWQDVYTSFTELRKLIEIKEESCK